MTTTTLCNILDLDTALAALDVYDATGSDILVLMMTGVNMNPAPSADLTAGHAAPIGPCLACDACGGMTKVYSWHKFHGKEVRTVRPCIACGETGLATLDGVRRQNPATLADVEFVRFGRERLNTVVRRAGAGDRRFAA